MAIMTVEKPDFLDDELLNADDIKAIVSAGAPVLVNHMQKHIQASLKRNHAKDSKLVKSVKARKTAKNKNGNGYHCFVGPSGTANTNSDGSRRKTPIRNMEKAMYLNYGTTGQDGKTRQAAKHWLEPTIRESEDEVIAKMQEEYEKRIKL